MNSPHPRKQSLKRPVSTPPATVIKLVLHVVVVGVVAPDEGHPGVGFAAHLGGDVLVGVYQRFTQRLLVERIGVAAPETRPYDRQAELLVQQLTV